MHKVAAFKKIVIKIPFLKLYLRFIFKSNVRKVFDPGNGFTNFGILTEGNTNFPQHVHGAGVQGTMLTNSFDMGGIAVASVDTIDWGSIA